MVKPEAQKIPNFMREINIWVKLWEASVMNSKISLLFPLKVLYILELEYEIVEAKLFFNVAL